MTQQVFASTNGGWVSSGGEIFKNAKNPWFVKNTKDVYYCVQFSSAEFSIDESRAVDLIHQSLTYWKEQFSNNTSIVVVDPIVTSEKVELNTQNFIYNKTCSLTEDIIFKFGYKNLNQDEIEYLGAPNKYLGVTIRKSYDEINLKGTGVVYISGDLGSQAYVKSSADTIDKAWQFPKLLQYVIIHELGHIFGIPHTGSGLMSEVFLDQLLIRKSAALFVREPISPFIKSYEQFQICDNSVLIPKGSQAFVSSFFNIKSADDCIKLEREQNKKEFKIYTRKKTENDSDWKQIGTLFVDQTELVDFSLKPAVLLQLSDKQTVFKSMGSSFLVGPVFQNYKVDGHINLGTSLKPYSVQIDFSPDSFVIYGNYNNQIRQVLTYGNPFLYSLLNPF
jgi:hypothetical protein